MKKIMIILALLVACGVSAQPKTIFLDSTFTETSEKSHVYYRVIGKYDSKNSGYQMKCHYRSGKLYSEGFSKLRDRYRPHGTTTLFSEEGTKKDVTTYEDGNVLGKHMLFYENGKLQLEGNFNPPLPGRELYGPVLEISNYWNNDNIQTVINGEGTIDYSCKNFSESGMIVNHKKSGIWKGYDNRTKADFTEEYENGILTLGRSTDSIGTYEYLIIEDKPTFIPDIVSFYKYIERNFHPPMDAVSGTLIVEFDINTDGALQNIKMKRSLSLSQDAEAKRLIAECPKWLPGKLRGKPVKTQYVLPIVLQAAE